MSTDCTYNLADLQGLLAAPCDTRTPETRLPGALLAVVARHAEARGESLSAFLRRAMVRTVAADLVSQRGAWVRAQTGEQFFQDDGTPSAGSGPAAKTNTEAQA